MAITEKTSLVLSGISSQLNFAAILICLYFAIGDLQSVPVGNLRVLVSVFSEDFVPIDCKYMFWF